MTVSPNHVELRIQEVVYLGRGLARLDGLVVLVPGTLAGETVRAEITVRHKRHAEARLLETLDPAPDRATPGCPLYDACPGCRYQHARYREEVRIKQAQLVNFLQRTAAWEETARVKPPIPSPRETGCRNRITLHVGASSAMPALGYVGEDNRTVLDVPDCPLALEPIRRRLAEFRAQPARRRSLPAKTDVTFRHTEQDGTLCWIGRGSPGKERLTERSPWGPLRTPRRGFFQVNPGLVPALTEAVGAEVAAAAPDIVVDLHCGSGLLSLAAGRAGAKRVVGVDVDAASVRFAQANARKLGVSEHVFQAGRAHELLPGIMNQVAPARTLLLADPPRRGLARETLRQIGDSAVPALLYVSCAPDTLARDVQRLADSGFRIRSVQMLDMFARTAGFESVVRLGR